MSSLRAFGALAVVALSLLVMAAAATGCTELLLGDEVREPTFGVEAENTPILCTDGVDNDGDGFADCNDDDCTDRGFEQDVDCRQAPCPGRVVCLTTEDTDKLCNDGVDNDGNGFTDCGDFGCARSPNVSICCTATGAEDTDEACTDGIDNDCNGYADCGDFSCSRSDTVTVCCTATGPEESDATCVDGIDNDCNGYTDCEDFGCSRSQNVTVCFDPLPASPENTEAACQDGIDNDRDGRIDCGDWDCDPENAASPFDYCLQKGSESDEGSCTDEVDNDRDGHVDCVDYDCWEGVPALCAG